MAFLIGVMGLVLFVPPWTFRYWQAWVYLALFAVSVGAIIPLAMSQRAQCR